MSQPRYVEFIRLKAIVDDYVDLMTVDGNEDTNESYIGGGANG